MNEPEVLSESIEGIEALRAYLKKFKDKEAERAGEALRKLSRVIEQTADSVVITDRNGSIEYVNPAFEKLTGYTKEEAIGKTPRILKSGTYDGQFYKKLWSTILSGGEFRCVLLNKKKSGELYYWEQTITPIHDERGTLTHFVSTAKDVTERMRAEQLKDEFVATVSHELRSPLTIVREGVSLVAEGALGTLSRQQQETLHLSLTALDRLSRLIRNLLDLSKTEAGKMPLKRERIDLVSVAREVCDAFHQQAQEKGLKLAGHFPNGQVEMYADRDKLTQVFTNLISNALKFTHQGSIEIVVVENSGAAVCSVTDTGCGIAQEDLPKVFEKFQQFGNTPHPAQRGTGLGLAICKALVELHGGEIGIRSAPAKGTVFTFTLPRKSPREIFQEAATERVRESLRQGTPLSVLVLQVTPFVENLEHLARSRLLRQADMVIADAPFLFVILPSTGKTNASNVAERFSQEAQAIVTLRGYGKAAQVSWKTVSFPEDAATEEGFTNAVTRMAQGAGTRSGP